MPEENKLDPSYKCSVRDLEHGCNLGENFKINDNIYMVIITYENGVVLLNEKIKTKRVSWKTWDKYNKKTTNKTISWNNEIKEIIKSELSELRKIYKKKKIKRTPFVKRTPIRRET